MQSNPILLDACWFLLCLHTNSFTVGAYFASKYGGASIAGFSLRMSILSQFAEHTLETTLLVA
jgi:hypothetical protein